MTKSGSVIQYGSTEPLYQKSTIKGGEGAEKPLAFEAKGDIIKYAEEIKAGREVLQHLTALCRSHNLPHSELSRQPHYTHFPLTFQGEYACWGLCAMRCRENPCTAFIFSAGDAPGGGTFRPASLGRPCREPFSKKFGKGKTGRPFPGTIF